MNKKFAVLSLVALLGLTSCGEAAKPSNSTKPTTPSSTVEPSKPSSSSTESLKNFENLVLNGKEVTYSGESFSLKVDNLPEGATVVYTNNDKTDAGTYVVTAKVSKEGYNDKILTATLKIKPADISGLVFEESTVTYDGKDHEVKVVGELPEGATVTYSCTNNENILNKVKNVGTYTIKAKIKCKNYNDVELTSTIKVLPASFEGITFEDQKIEYDSKPHTVSIVGNLPEGATVTYSCEENADITNKVVEPGEYTIKAKITCKNYKETILTAKVSVVSKDVQRFVTSHNGKIYFQNALDKDRLYLYDASATENKVVKVNNNKPQYFTTYKNELYYRSDSIVPAIVKINSTTNKTETIFGDNAEYIIDDEEYIYYADNSLVGDNGIYRVKMTGSGDNAEVISERLYDGKAYYLSLVGNNIYFADGKNGKKLSRISKNIPGQTISSRVIDSKIKNMISKGTNLYFTINNLKGDYIVKYNTNDNKLIKLTSDSGKYLTLAGNDLYYVNDDLLNSNVFGKGVYKVNTNVTKDNNLPGKLALKQEFKDFPISSLTYQDGSLYFYQTNDKKLYEYNLSSEKLTDTLDGFVVPEDKNLVSLNGATEIYKNKVYYQNQYDSNCLYVYDTVSKSNVKVTSTAVNDLFVYNDYLYYRQVSYFVNKDLYRMNIKEGGEPELITKNDCADLEIVNDKVYYVMKTGSNGIHVMDLDGKNDTLLVDKDASNLTVYKDKLYYVLGDTGADNIYCIDLTKNEKTPVKIGDFKTTFFEIKDDKIYFRNVKGLSKNLSVADLDGNNVTVLYNTKCDPNNFVIVDDVIYYNNDAMGQFGVESFNLTTKEHKIIKDKVYAAGLQYLNGKLYYQSHGAGGDSHFYELSLDGTLTRID